MALHALVAVAGGAARATRLVAAAAPRCRAARRRPTAASSFEQRVDSAGCAAWSPDVVEAAPDEDGGAGSGGHRGAATAARSSASAHRPSPGAFADRGRTRWRRCCALSAPTRFYGCRMPCGGPSECQAAPCPPSSCRRLLAARGRAALRPAARADGEQPVDGSAGDAASAAAGCSRSTSAAPATRSRRRRGARPARRSRWTAWARAATSPAGCRTGRTTLARWIADPQSLVPGTRDAEHGRVARATRATWRPTWARCVEPGAARVLHAVRAPRRAQHRRRVGWVLFGGAALIFVGVMALLALVAAPPARRRPRRGRACGSLGGGLVFPVVVLAALLRWTRTGAPACRGAAGRPALVVGVTGHMWWWEVRYRDRRRAATSCSPTSCACRPAGRVPRPDSADVIHSFWVPALAGKIDMCPGRVHTCVLRPTRPGVYRGQCAEFCGEQHARMALHVVAMPPAEFDAWLRGAGAPAARRDGAAAARGRRRLPRRSAAPPATRCAALGRGRRRGGPDLTHVGSRCTLGAGTLPQRRGRARRAGSPACSTSSPARACRRTTGSIARDAAALAAWLGRAAAE